MEQQQQAYRPEVKTEMKQEAPTSFLPPEASQLKPDRQQFQSRKRPYEENRGRGGTSSTERRGGADLLSLPLKRMKMTLTTLLLPSTHITATFTSRWPETGVVATLSQLKVLHTYGQEPVPATGSEGAVCALR